MQEVEKDGESRNVDFYFHRREKGNDVNRKQGGTTEHFSLEKDEDKTRLFSTKESRVGWEKPALPVFVVTLNHGKNSKPR